jgi:hypothetical protein
MNALLLTEAEIDRLAECEAVIEGGWQTTIDVANALLEIRDLRLYRKDYATFETYCKGRWGFERAHAYRLMDAAGVVQNLSPMGDIQPTNERQVRPLTDLEPEQQREVWKEAVETAPNGKVTAAHVEEVKAQKVEPAKPKAAERRDKVLTIQNLTKALAKEFGPILRNRGLDSAITFSWTKGEVEEVIETECGWRYTAIVDRGEITINFSRSQNERCERIENPAARKALISAGPVSDHGSFLDQLERVKTNSQKEAEGIKDMTQKTQPQ